VLATRNDAERGSHRVLAVIGNDQAGTYYPVAVSVVPFLGELLTHQNQFTWTAALSALVDLLASFETAPGYEVFDTPVAIVALLRSSCIFSHKRHHAI
jgi:hypothetical protein